MQTSGGVDPNLGADVGDGDHYLGLKEERDWREEFEIAVGGETSAAGRSFSCPRPLMPMCTKFKARGVGWEERWG